MRLPKRYSLSRFHYINDSKHFTNDDYSNKLFKKTLRNKSQNNNVN